MAANGKIDKGYLRQLYRDKMAKAEINILKPISNKPNEITNLNCANIGDNGIENYFDREVARRTLADVLGLKDKDGKVMVGIPKDDEDFFELGGDSLLVSIRKFYTFNSFEGNFYHFLT